MTSLQYLIYCSFSGIIYGTVMGALGFHIGTLTFWFGLVVCIIFNSVIVPKYFPIEWDD